VRQVPVESTTLSRAGYSRGDAILELVFRSGEVYRYFDVPVEIYEGLLRADSKGGYFNDHIRNMFRYQHVGNRSAGSSG
jgi:hypothetical protein